jgi:hypothetical protein
MKLKLTGADLRRKSSILNPGRADRSNKLRRRVTQLPWQDMATKVKCVAHGAKTKASLHIVQAHAAAKKLAVSAFGSNRGTVA